jgi:hypothetical protein
MIVFIIAAMLITIPVCIVLAIVISVSMRKTKRMQDERESKWCGGAR